MSEYMPKCSTCRALFQNKEDLKGHLKARPECKTEPKNRVRDPTASSSRRTIPNSSSIHHHHDHSTGELIRGRPKFEDDTLLGAMESGVKKTMMHHKSGCESSVFSAIAEGDAELLDAYKKLSIDPKSGKRTLNPDIVSTAATKANFDVNHVADMIKKAQRVSLCFLLDTTLSMKPYIDGVKDQISQIIIDVEGSHCDIAGLAFVGYKDWSNGKLIL